MKSDDPGAPQPAPTISSRSPFAPEDPSIWASGEGMRLLEKARSARPEGQEDVENASQPLDSSSDLPIETQASSIDPENPDLKQPEVEGAVT